MKSDSSLRRLLPFAAYFNICFFWGTAGVANKLSSSMIHPFFAGSLRFLIASVLMALWVGFRHESLAVGLRDGKTLAVGSVLMYFLNTVLLLFASRRGCGNKHGYGQPDSHYDFAGGLPCRP